MWYNNIVKNKRVREIFAMSRKKKEKEKPLIDTSKIYRMAMVVEGTEERETRWVDVVMSYTTTAHMVKIEALEKGYDQKYMWDNYVIWLMYIKKILEK